MNHQKLAFSLRFILVTQSSLFKNRYMRMVFQISAFNGNHELYIIDINCSWVMHVLLERNCSDRMKLMSRLGVAKSRAGPDGRPFIRSATLLNFLKRVAFTHNLEFTSLNSVDDGSHRSATWRLGSECFAVQIYVTKASAMEYDSSTFAPSVASFDELVHVSAVCFEHSHEQSMSSELVSDLNAGKFDSLAQHISNLMTIYSIPGSNLERVRAYLCLHVLEQDLSMLSQTQRVDLTEAERNAALALRPLAIHTMEPADRQRMVNSSLVGLFLNRSGGRLGQLTYLVTPAQTAIAKATEKHGSIDNISRPIGASSSNRITLGRGAVDALSRHGFSARVGIRSRLPFDDFVSNQATVQHLPIIPLVTLRETSFGDSVPDFAEPDELKCVALEAELVLYLDPPIALPTEAVRELEIITGLKNSELLETDEDDLTRLILAQHNQQYLYGINRHILLPNYTQHSYAIRSNVRGFLVRTIPFTCSSQLSSIIALLRKHASLMAFYETFVLHPSKPFEKDELMTFNFDIEISSDAPLRVTFDHPCDPSRRVDLAIHIGPFEVTHAKVNEGFLVHDSTHRVVVNSDPTDIFARSHSLPVGLVWLLFRLGCPVQKSLLALESSRSLSSLNDNTVSGRLLTNTNRLEQLRGMLSRARSHVLIQGASGTGGILTGADRFDAPELDMPLSYAMPTMSSIGARSSLKLPPLPPGVLATPPPMLSHTEHNNSLDLVTNVLSAVRGGEPSGKSLPISGVSSPSPITPGSRGLRLDDLLVGNVIQHCFPPSTTGVACSSVPTASLATLTSSVTATGAIVTNDFPPYSTNQQPTNAPQAVTLASQSKLIAAMREFTPDPLASPGLCSTASPKQLTVASSSLSVHNANSHINVTNSIAPYSLPSVYGSRTGGQPVSTASISIPGTFTQSSPINYPILGAKPNATATTAPNKNSTSGSMLVNLLNEDPIPPSAAPVLPQTAHCVPSPRLGAPPNQPPALSTYPDLTRDPYVMPGTIGSSRFISSPDKSSPLGSGKLPGTSGTPLSTGATVSASSVQQAKPTSLHSPRSAGGLMTSSTITKARSTLDAYSLPSSSDSTAVAAVATATTGATGPTFKKARKRRRAEVDTSSSATSFKSGSSVPGVGSLSTPSVSSSANPTKHSRLDGSTVPHGSLLRTTYSGGTTSNFAMVSSAAVSSISHSVTNTGVPGKSVYDFDDNPSSSFDMPSLPQNNPISTTYQSGSTGVTTKLTAPLSTYVSGPSAPSSGPTGLPHHPSNLSVTTTIVSSSLIPTTERTVERKTSLKMTIKTLPPPQQSNSFSKVSSSAEVVSTKLGSPEAKSKHLISGSGAPGLKKRKRRSVEGKPSSYVLQMFQPPSSAISLHSGAPLAGVKLPKPNAVRSHANSIVKKERKRRITHMMTERTPQATTGTVTGSVTLSADPSTISPDAGKPVKPNRSRESSAERVRTKPLQIPLSGNTERTGSSLTGAGGTTISGRKKVTCSPLPGSVGDDGSAIRRQHLSSTGIPVLHSDSGEIKRRKHGENSKHLTSSHQLNLSSSSVSESDDMLSTSSNTFDSFSTNLGTLKHTSKSSSSSTGGLNLINSRSGAGTGLNSGSKISTMTPYSLGSQNSSLPTSSGSSTGGSGTGASVGLIKGYKIPKKKTNSQSNPTPSTIGTGKTDVNSISSVSSEVAHKAVSKPISAEVAKDNPECIGASGSQNSSSTPNSSAGTTVSYTSTTPTAKSDLTMLNQQTQNQQSTASGITIPTTTASAAASTGPSATQPRRRINDIADILRAKSSSSVSGPSGSGSATGCSDGPVSSDVDRCSSSGEPLEPDAAAGQTDQRGDNIFEKFSSSTPTPTDSSKQSTQGDGSHKSPVFGSEANAGQGPGPSSDQTSPNHTSVDGVTEELIKAQTDTPASPTEASAHVPTPPSDSTSKIIPISPTSAKRMGSNQIQTTHSDHLASQSRGALISRKNSTSTRFSRPAIGSSHPHTVPDSYMRSIGSHPRGIRPPRVFSHGMHRPKAGTFKGHGSWPSGPVDFTASAASAGGESSGPGGPIPPGPWRMPNSGSVPGGASGGGNGPQQSFNPTNPPHSMPMHSFPPGGPRPMQHPPGAFGAGGNMYGGAM